MGWTEKLDNYELLSIGLIIIGVVIRLARTVVFYSLNVHMFHFDSLGHETYGKMMSISSNIHLLGTFIMGVGFFLALKKIDDRFEVHEYFQYLNYTYLILLFPNLFYIIESLIFNGLRDPSLLTLMIFWSGNILLPGVAFFLLIVMLILLFIRFYRKESVLIEKMD